MVSTIHIYSYLFISILLLTSKSCALESGGARSAWSALRGSWHCVFEPGDLRGHRLGRPGRTRVVDLRIARGFTKMLEYD